MAKDINVLLIVEKTYVSKQFASNTKNFELIFIIF